MKGVPLAYVKDMQEDKVPVFEAADALELCLAATAGMVQDMVADAEAMRRVAASGYSTATDLADWLTRVARLPFREAHHVAGSLVKRAEEIALRARRPAVGRRCGRSSRASTKSVFEILDRRSLGREPHQLRRHRPPKRDPRRSRRAQAFFAEGAVDGPRRGIKQHPQHNPLSPTGGEG